MKPPKQAHKASIIPKRHGRLLGRLVYMTLQEPARNSTSTMLRANCFAAPRGHRHKLDAPGSQPLLSAAQPNPRGAPGLRHARPGPRAQVWAASQPGPRVPPGASEPDHAPPQR